MSVEYDNKAAGPCANKVTLVKRIRVPQMIDGVETFSEFESTVCRECGKVIKTRKVG